MVDLSLFGSYTHSNHILYLSQTPKGYIYIGTYTDTCLRLILFSISHRSYRTYSYTTEFTLVRRYPKVSQRLRDVYWYYRTYPYMKVPVGTTKLILVLRILYLFYEVYPGLTELILVLQNLYMYYKSYTCNTKLILVL